MLGVESGRFFIFAVGNRYFLEVCDEGNELERGNGCM